MWFISVPLLVLILLVVGITVLVVKGGSIALRLTGLDEKRAFFQALSAVTGTGFTTRESELVVSNPTRRKIVAFLMIFGNVVLVTVVGLLIGMFVGQGERESKFAIPIHTIALALGGYVVYRFFMARWFSAAFNRWFERLVMSRWRLRERPVSEVLAMAEGHGVAEVLVEAASPCAGKTLADSHLREAGLLVLAIRRGEDVVPTPSAHDRIRPGDRLVCYGELARMHAFTGAPPEPPAEAETLETPTPPTQEA
jgi:hypothetical protein